MFTLSSRRAFLVTVWGLSCKIPPHSCMEKYFDGRRFNTLLTAIAPVAEVSSVHNSTSDVSILHGLHMLHELLEIHGTSCNGIYLSATKTVLNQSPLLQTLSYLLTNSNAKPRIGIRKTNCKKLSSAFL